MNTVLYPVIQKIPGKTLSEIHIFNIFYDVRSFKCCIGKFYAKFSRKKEVVHSCNMLSIIYGIEKVIRSN